MMGFRVVADSINRHSNHGRCAPTEEACCGSYRIRDNDKLTPSSAVWISSVLSPFANVSLVSGAKYRGTRRGPKLEPRISSLSKSEVHPIGRKLFSAIFQRPFFNSANRSNDFFQQAFHSLASGVEIAFR